MEKSDEHGSGSVSKGKIAWRNFLARYALALVCFGLTLGLSLLLREAGIRINLTIPVVLALVATAWYGGLGPGILLSVLFQGTTIFYSTAPREPDPYKAAFAYFSVFALYIFLVVVLSRLRTTLATVQEQRDLLSVTLSSIGDAVMTTDTDGRLTFLNPAAERMTGWTNGAAAGSDVRSVIKLLNETTRDDVENPVSKVLASGATQALANHTILVARDGRETPIDDTAAPIMDKDRVRGVVMVITDVTERKRAERARRESLMMQRVVEAQESERYRIARDLHDQLGQKMTGLRLRIQTLLDDCDEYHKVREAMAEVERAASSIDHDIGYLSWELRPTELEDLGLIDALGSFVRIWSKQYEIEAEFQTSGISEGSEQERFSVSFETNLYRIVQEALNNILKHAQADRVSVLLQRNRDQIVLIVEDNGIGFDDEQEPAVGEVRKGHGLVGIRERAALMSGSLDIDSSENGTSLIVRVPAPQKTAAVV